MSDIISDMMEMKYICMKSSEIYNERNIVLLFIVPTVGCWTSNKLKFQ
jgi:hypothetical protein